MGLVFQRERIFRGMPWDSMPDPVDQLAQELIAMFRPDVPLVSQGPITVANDGSGQGVIFTGFGPDDSVFSVQTGGRTYDFSVNSSGALTGPGGEPVGGGGGGKPSGGGGGIRGQVVSGTGNTYTVSIPGGTVTVTQLRIDPTATIPPGTAAVVFQDASGYFMQVPVWLGDF